MNTIAIAPIVEGHGEEEAVPVLLRRAFAEFADMPYVDVLKPIRIPRSKLVREADLLKAVDLADLKLKSSKASRSWVIVLFDADEDRACELGPSLFAALRSKRPHLDTSVVLSAPEYETWSVAAAESLRDYLNLDDIVVPEHPELGAKKAWLRARFKGRDTETIEQPALSARMDLRLCRSRAPSFDKLRREIEARAPKPTSEETYKVP